jgi:hypothetical protein
LFLKKKINKKKELGVVGIELLYLKYHQKKGKGGKRNTSKDDIR